MYNDEKKEVSSSDKTFSLSAFPSVSEKREHRLCSSVPYSIRPFRSAENMAANVNAMNNILFIPTLIIIFILLIKQSFVPVGSVFEQKAGFSKTFFVKDLDHYTDNY
ncbi:MAG: hypothetical protein ACM3Q2_16700 [Syntrophothermus sp.]